MEFLLNVDESEVGLLLRLLKLDFWWCLCVNHGKGKGMNLQLEALTVSYYYPEQIAILLKLIAVRRNIFFIQQLVLEC